MIHTNIVYEDKCPNYGSSNIKEYLYYSECQNCGCAEAHRVNKV